jgi:hypothetical protein
MSEQVMKLCFNLAFCFALGIFQAEKIDNEVSSEEYAVYSAYLDTLDKSPQDGARGRLAVINDQSEKAESTCLPEKIVKFNKKISTAELRPLFDDLRTKDQSTKIFGRFFKVRHDYVLLNSKDFKAFFQTNRLEGGWEDFYKKYPKSSGYITFSRVGFNQDQTKAIFFKDSYCGSLCGSGDYVLFIKSNGKWKVSNIFNCWVS